VIDEAWSAREGQYPSKKTEIKVSANDSYYNVAAVA
jgi:hypothetical protein